jgi:diguanylate cyclase (GGDEF)-like protein
MRHNTRKTDIIGRFGGDEFVLIMPETRLNEALILLERLRRRARSITLPNGRRVTISLGLTEWDGSTLDTPERILKRADAALYEAKENGRNCVIPSRPAPSRV